MSMPDRNEKWERFQQKFFWRDLDATSGGWREGHGPNGPKTYNALMRVCERFPDRVLDELVNLEFLEFYVTHKAPARNRGLLPFALEAGKRTMC
jgi:hypothetical protein